MLTHIRKSRTHGYWNLQILAPISYSNWFQTHEGAVTKAKQVFTRYRKECSAYSMATQIQFLFLTTIEYEFVYKVLKNKCKGITESQYGYLKGIYERQQRKW